MTMKLHNVFFILGCTLCLEMNGLAQSEDNPPPPMTKTQRLHWVARFTVGPQSLAAGVFSSAWGTARDSPEEYETHWSGFAKRYGIRFVDVATSNTFEAGLGAIWSEDPRFERSGKDRLLDRVKYAGRMTFEAKRA